jgi:hypothetical protein
MLLTEEQLYKLIKESIYEALSHDNVDWKSGYEIVGNGYHDGWILIIHESPFLGYNYINKNGELLSDTWFSKATDFKDGIALVVIKRKINFLKPNGELLSNIGFKRAWWFDADGYSSVSFNGKQYKIDKEGNVYNHAMKPKFLGKLKDMQQF